VGGVDKRTMSACWPGLAARCVGIQRSWAGLGWLGWAGRYRRRYRRYRRVVWTDRLMAVECRRKTAIRRVSAQLIVADESTVHSANVSTS